nr:FecR domain-containing protein [Microbacter margulisiae]
MEQKYKTNNLTDEELKTLRDYVNSMSDEQLATRLFDEWLNNGTDLSFVDSKRLDKLKEEIDRSIDNSHYNFLNIKKIGQIAAAILLPVFIITTLFFYKENHQLTSEEMVVTTGNNERANVNLPDGTNVTLNSNSRLAYAPMTYNKSTRQIVFEGEGYFQIRKDPDRPFLIEAKGLRVKDLGTVFDLRVYGNSNTAELALERGCVQFTSIKANQNVILDLGDKAILEQKTGKITVIRAKDIENASAWKRGYLSFHATALCDIISNLEASYGVNIIIDNKTINDSTDLFTGTIPITNLNEALFILQKSYHLSCRQKQKDIILYKP